MIYGNAIKMHSFSAVFLSRMHTPAFFVCVVRAFSRIMKDSQSGRVFFKYVDACKTACIEGDLSVKRAEVCGKTPTHHLKHT